MHGNKNTSTTPSEAGQAIASNQRKQEEGAGASSPSSSSSMVGNVSRDRFDNSVDRYPQKQATSASARAASASVAVSPSSPSAKMLNCSMSEGGATDTEDPDPYPLWTKPVEPAAGHESSARLSSSSSSPTSTRPNLAPPQETTSSRAPCQHPGCSKSAKYGPQDAPPIACQAHKRTGQYRVNRKGELLIATRDGDAFRTPTVVAPAVVCPPIVSETTADAAAPSSAKRRSTDDGSGNAPSSSHRKKAAKLSPSPRQTLNRANRPALVNGNKGSPASQNRACLFPGCDAQPHYGLPGAVRAVYCFSHKKGSMVRVSKEALGVQNHGENEISTAPTAVESNKKQKAPVPTSASDKKNVAKKAWGEPESKGDHRASPAGPVGEKRVKKGGRGNAAGGAAMEGSVPPAAAAAAAPEAPEEAAQASLTTETDGEDGAAAVSAKQAHPPSVSRLADTSGMSPSAEILVLRQAREAAKQEAEASGGGRRPRAPSRRALEASGRMKSGGAQWMTREKKAEEARVKKELREQRRQYRAAGLSVGVVIEAFVAPATGGVADGGGAGGGKDRETGEVRGEPGWQKVSPALLVASPRPTPTKKSAVATVAMEEVGKAS